MNRELCELKDCVFSLKGRCQTRLDPFEEEFVMGGESTVIKCKTYTPKEKQRN